MNKLLPILLVLFIQGCSVFENELVGKHLLCNNNFLITFISNDEAYACSKMWKKIGNYPDCKENAYYEADDETIYFKMVAKYNINSDRRNWSIDRVTLKGSYSDTWAKNMGLNCKVPTQNHIDDFRYDVSEDIQKQNELKHRYEQYEQFQEEQENKRIDKIKKERKI